MSKITVDKELLEFALGFKCHGHKNLTEQLEDRLFAATKIRQLLADPVPPAGGEPEVFEPHAWAQTDGPAINAFTQEFDIAEGWATAGYGTVELLNREHVDAEIDRLRGEHQAIATRLQAEVHEFRTALQVANKNTKQVIAERAALQSELTKARELTTALSKGFNTLEQAEGKYRVEMKFSNRDDAWAAYDALSNQSAPADKR